MNQLLLDSSFLYEINNSRGPKHRQSVEFLARTQQIRIIPDVALTETAYLLKFRIGQRAVLSFLDGLDSPGIQLEPVSIADVKRARQILSQYESANLDFVDCCLMALSERLNVTQVATFDRRDFAIFRPTHCDYLELLS